MNCPECNQEIEDYVECDTDKPFTAATPMEGLRVWSAYSVDKTLLHVSGQIVHIRFWDKHDRLIKMLRATP